MSSLHDFGALGQASHAHGTRANYLTGCRCVPCRSANACYEAQRASARAQGRADLLVDAAAARRQLCALAAAGIGHRRAAHLAGVATKTVKAIRRGTASRIRASVEQAILGVQRPSLARGVKVNGYRTRYLLACLQAEGYSLRALARRLGLRGSHLPAHAGRVTVQTHLQTEALYRDLTAEEPEP